MPCDANWAPPPILPECGANCIGSQPLLATINLSAVTASVLENTFQPSDVLLTVNGAPRGSWGYTLSSSSRASKVPICAPPASVSFSRRVRVMVHPALFWSHFDAKKLPALPWPRSICPRTPPALLRERKTASRQAKLGVNLSARVCPQL